jgi:hypothetical protein
VRTHNLGCARDPGGIATSRAALEDCNIVRDALLYAGLDEFGIELGEVDELACDMQFAVLVV